MDSSREATELVSKQMRANNRRYYFDVKENGKGDRYLTISETQPGNNDFRRVRLMVFEDHFEGFFKILKELKNEMVFSRKKVKEKQVKK